MESEMPLPEESLNEVTTATEKCPERPVGLCNGHRYFAVQFDVVLALVLAYTCALTLPISHPLIIRVGVLSWVSCLFRNVRGDLFQDIRQMVVRHGCPGRRRPALHLETGDHSRRLEFG